LEKLDYSIATYRLFGNRFTPLSYYSNHKEIKACRLSKKAVASGLFRQPARGWTVTSGDCARVNTGRDKFMYQSFFILKIIRSNGERKRGLLNTTIFMGAPPLIQCELLLAA
jgi:hypothetical protein